MKETNKIFERNIEALEKSDPALAGRLKGGKGYDLRRWEMFAAENGQITARKILEKDRARLIHSRCNPGKEGAGWAELVYPVSETLVILGFGLGYHVLALKDYGYKKLVIVEADTELFRLALCSVSLESVLSDSKTHFLLGESPETIGKFFEYIGLGRLHYRMYFPVTDLYPDYYPPIRDILEGHVFRRRMKEDPVLCGGIEKLLAETIQ
jgi:hypothetical protein